VSEPKTLGLGDKVAEVTSALGIKQTPGCGCGRRQEALNKIPADQGVIDTIKGIVKAMVVVSPETSEDLVEESEEK